MIWIEAKLPEIAMDYKNKRPQEDSSTQLFTLLPSEQVLLFNAFNQIHTTFVKKIYVPDFVRSVSASSYRSIGRKSEDTYALCRHLQSLHTSRGRTRKCWGWISCSAHQRCFTRFARHWVGKTTLELGQSNSRYQVLYIAMVRGQRSPANSGL